MARQGSPLWLQLYAARLAVLAGTGRLRRDHVLEAAEFASAAPDEERLFYGDDAVLDDITTPSARELLKVLVDEIALAARIGDSLGDLTDSDAFNRAREFFR